MYTLNNLVALSPRYHHYPVFEMQAANPILCRLARTPCGHWRYYSRLDTTIAAQWSKKVLIDNFQLVAQGNIREKELLELLSSGSYPARNPAKNIADLQAQIAAMSAVCRNSARW